MQRWLQVTISDKRMLFTIREWSENSGIRSLRRRILSPQILIMGVCNKNAPHIREAFNVSFGERSRLNRLFSGFVDMGCSGLGILKFILNWESQFLL